MHAWCTLWTAGTATETKTAVGGVCPRNHP
jgi:hypothetical protein